MWIMGAVMVALCGALFTMVRTSDNNRHATLVETEVRRYAEAIPPAVSRVCDLIQPYDVERQQHLCVHTRCRRLHA